MKKGLKMTEDTLRTEYDFSKLGNPVRGKYAKHFHEGTSLVLLDKDVVQAFPDERSVNDALRLLIALAKNQVPKTISEGSHH